MRLLQQAIRREMHLQFAASLALFLLGLYLAYSTFHSNLPLMITGLAISLIAAKLLHYTISNLRQGSNRLLDVIHGQPAHIVWIYAVRVEHKPFGILLFRSGTMYFRMADGMELSVHLPQRHLRTVSHFLHRLLPHATFGYSDDREYSFRLSPENLRKDRSDYLN